MRPLAIAVLLGSVTSACNGPDVRGPFEGRIVDADTGAAIEGAHVVVVWTHLMNWFEGGRREVDARETITDAQGRWSIPERPTSFWEGGIAGVRRRFYVFAPGYDIADPAGTPRDQYAGRETTVTTMRSLASRDERCRQLEFTTVFVPNNTVRIPLYLKGVDEERQRLAC